LGSPITACGPGNTAAAPARGRTTGTTVWSRSSPARRSRADAASGCTCAPAALSVSAPSACWPRVTSRTRGPPAASGCPSTRPPSYDPLRLRRGTPWISSSPATPSTRAHGVRKATWSGTPSRRRRVPSATAPRLPPPWPLALPAPERAHAPVFLEDGGPRCLHLAVQTAPACQGRHAASHKLARRAAFTTPLPPGNPRVPTPATLNPHRPSHRVSSNTIFPTARGSQPSRSSLCLLASTRKDSYSLGGLLSLKAPAATSGHYARRPVRRFAPPKCGR
jgi:hypothetical protein